jgi:hypothetical protein
MSQPASEHGTGSGGGTEVLVAEPVIATLRGERYREVAPTVLRTIKEIGHIDGEPLDLDEAGQFMAIVPAGNAPVVVYRPMRADEGHGYLVTGLVDRRSYESYRRAQKQGLLDTDAGRAMLRTAVTAVTATGNRR